MLLWDAKTGKIKKMLGSHPASVIWTSWSQYGKPLASYSRNNRLAKIWDVSTGKVRQRIQIAGRVGCHHTKFTLLKG